MANVVVLVLIVLYVILRASLPALWKGTDNVDREREREEMRQQIMRDPRNGAAYHELARSYNKEGKLREAYQVYQALLPYLSDVDRFEVTRRMQDLERDIRMDSATRHKGFGVEAPRLSQVDFCKACGASNPRGAQQCWECHQLLEVHDNPIDNFHRRWQDPSFRRVVTDSVMGTAMAVGLIWVCYDATMEIRLVAIVVAGIVIASQVWLRVTGR